MKKKILISQQDLELLFDTLGINAGTYICLQCSDAFCQQVIGGARTILDLLMDKIGTAGSLFMPTFTPEHLDPSCHHAYPCEEWNLVREDQKGYHPMLSLSMKNPLITNQFLRYEGVLRTKHPVYSFAYWGFIDEKTFDQRLNYPISFANVLQPFAQGRAVELLLGVDPKESVLIPGIAKTLNLGTTILERAKAKKGSGDQSRTFLSIKVDSKAREKALRYVYSKSDNLKEFNVFLLSLDEFLN